MKNMLNFLTKFSQVNGVLFTERISYHTHQALIGLKASITLLLKCMRTKVELDSAITAVKTKPVLINGTHGN